MYDRTLLTDKEKDTLVKNYAEANEIDEKDEFAPVKNDESKPTCTAATARYQISELGKKWYKESGGNILNDNEKK